MTIWREHGDRNFQAYSLRRLGQLAWHEMEYAKAIALCTDSLNLNVEVGDRRGIIACLAGFTAIAIAQENWARAPQLAGVVENQLNSIGIRLLQLDQAEFEHNLSRLTLHLDESILINSGKRAEQCPSMMQWRHALQVLRRAAWRNFTAKKSDGSFLP